MFNPSVPVAEHVVPSDPSEAFALSDLYANRQKIGNFAMISLCEDLITNGALQP